MGEFTLHDQTSPESTFDASSGPSARPLISVCILAGHGAQALDACLGSLRAQVSPPAFELLVGGDPTPEVLAVVHRHFPAAPVCRTGGRLPGAARNPLVERSRGELLLFLDDDVTVRSDLLSKLAATAARYPGVSVFGGPNDTPTGSSMFQVVQGAVLSSLVGSGPVSRRYGARHAGPADERWFTLCNLAVRRRVMLPFLRDLVCAEENALLAELQRRREKMRYEPSLRVFHDRRPTPRSFAKQMFKYGRGRGELIRRDPNTTRLAYLAPSMLLLYLVASVGVGLISGPIVLLPGGLYLALALGSAVRIGWTLRSGASVPLALALILTLHAGYGAGVIRGLAAPGAAAEHAAAQWTSASPHVAPGAPGPDQPHASGAARHSLVQDPV